MATDYASMIPKEDLASFQKANPGKSFTVEDYSAYNDPNSYVYKMNSLPTNNSTINSQNLAQGASVKIPTYQPTPVDPNIAQGAIASVAGQYEAVNKQLEQAQADQKAQAESQLSLQSALIGKTADTQAFQETAGVNAANDTVRQYATQLADLNAQASTLNREAQAIPIQVQNESVGRGRTGAGIAPIESARLRDNALKALSIAQQADIASAALTGSQLKLQAAKDKAQQMVDLKYKPLEDQLALKKQQYDLNKDILSQIDKKRTEALNLAIKKEERDLEEKKNNEKGISDLVTNASAQGAPADLRARAAKAKTPMEAANILGVYAGDYMKMKTYESQLLTDKAQRANIYSQIAERNAESIKKQQLANFQAPPIVNATTGQVDPRSVIASIVKSTGNKLKGGQSALDVLSSVQVLANRNAKGTFEGVGFGGGVIPERFKSQNAISNRQDIEAIGLKVQQWASGASLTKEQTEMVNKFTPQLGDSDNAVKTKINGLVNFMMQQVSSDLAGQGINYNPETIDMFSGLQSVDNQTLLKSIPSSTGMQSKVDNKTFFTR